MALQFTGNEECLGQVTGDRVVITAMHGAAVLDCTSVCQQLSTTGFKWLWNLYDNLLILHWSYGQLSFTLKCQPSAELTSNVRIGNGLAHMLSVAEPHVAHLPCWLPVTCTNISFIELHITNIEGKSHCAFVKILAYKLGNSVHGDSFTSRFMLSSCLSTVQLVFINGW